MKFIYDHDYHIHTFCSQCSRDPEQTPEAILSYARKRGLKSVCITDHFWDEEIPGASEWYKNQNYGVINKSKPFPESDDVKMMFGCESEIDKSLNYAMTKKRYDCFDFIVISTTHYIGREGVLIPESAIKSPETRAAEWVKRLDAVLAMELPFHKIGIAHLNCKQLAPDRETLIKTLDAIPVDAMEKLFEKAAKIGVGIELNAGNLKFSDDETETILKPFRIAKKCGCKFYCGSDAHETPQLYAAKEILEKTIDLLGLEETDKKHIGK